MSEKGPDKQVRWQPSLNRTPGVSSSIKRWSVILAAAAMGVLGGCGKACQDYLEASEPENTGDCSDPRNRFERDCICKDDYEQPRWREWARCDEWDKEQRVKYGWPSPDPLDPLDDPCYEIRNGVHQDPQNCNESSFYGMSDAEMEKMGVPYKKQD
jgi:hypothetical protein